MGPELLLALGTTCIAGLIRGFTGGFSSMLMASIFIHIFTPVQTVGMIIILELIVSAQMLPAVRKQIDWPVIVPMGLMATLFMPIGHKILVSTDPELLTRTTGALVLFFSAILLIGWQYQGPKPLAATLSIGAFSGFLMAITSFGGPPVLIYLLSSTDKAATNRANIIGYLTITLISMTIIMTATSLIDHSTIKTVLILLPAYMITIWIGSRLFQKSNERLYRHISIAILIMAGLYGVLQ